MTHLAMTVDAPVDRGCNEWQFFHDRPFCGDEQFCKGGRFVLAKEITNQILDRASGVFGKLVLLSSLCERSAGGYQHPALDKVVPPCVASLVLRSNHERLFSTWLELILEEQWKEISEYLAAPEAGEATPGEASGEFWETLIPRAARQPERELFLSDLKLILSLQQK
jgi:hypothetical protein